MHKLVEPILSKIYSELPNDPSSSLSLIGGKSGEALYRFMYLQYMGLKDAVEFQNEIQQLAEDSLVYNHIDFNNEKSGLNWFFTYLYKNKLLDIEDWEFLCPDYDDLANTALEMLENDNYDFLHGATGIAYHLLYTESNAFNDFYSRFFVLLQSLVNKSVEKKVIPNYDFEKNQSNPNQINLGLSHGIPSILKFCIQYYKQNVCVAEAELMAKDIIDYLLTHTNKDKSSGYFPSIIETGEEINTPSRLAWCYGDLGAGYILYQAGITFNNQKAIDFALEVLVHSTKRQDLDKAGVMDASICHGAAGVAHIYHKMWHYTQELIFKQACDFWIQKTLDFATHEDGLAGYKQYNPITDTYLNEYGLLEGAAGIGLVLLSYLTSDFSWDYCLMLND